MSGYWSWAIENNVSEISAAVLFVFVLIFIIKEARSKLD